MSSIVVEFEVLPDDSGASTPQVCEDLKRQLADPGSVLRNGEFGRYAANATLTGDGLGDMGGACGSGGCGSDRGGGVFPPPPPPEEEDRPSPPPLPRQEAQPSFPLGSGGSAAYGFHGQQQAPRDLSGELPGSGYPGSSEWQGLSNPKLVERIADLERQLQRTAAGARQDAAASTASLRRAGGASQSDVMALEEKCFQMQQRLETVERELRDTTEAYRLYRQKHDSSDLDMKLKDREQLLVHAKEMWMKENVRASKLADALTAAEDRLADQEKRLAEVAEKYNEAQQEVRALQHLVGSNGSGAGAGVGAGGGGGFGDSFALEKKNGRAAMSTSTGDLSSMGASRPPGTGSTFDVSFTRDNLAGSARAIPSTAPGMGAQEQPLNSGPPMPLDAETNADRFRRLCLLNDAVLYEDEMLQVGLKAEYQGREGQIAVFFGNKGGAALQAFTVQYFVKEERALRMSASPINQQINSDKQVLQRVTVSCQEPFAHPPWLRIQFLLPDSSPRRIQMKLPVIITKFMVGRELSSQDFFQCWRQQHYVLNEATAIVNLAPRLRQPLVHVARTIVFGGALRLHHGVDNNPDNFVLVGQLAEQKQGAAGQDFDVDRGRDVFGLGGDKEQGLSLVRVEVGSGRFSGKARVVVRSSDHTVARTLCDCIAEQLSGDAGGDSQAAAASR